ncbi:Cuticle protein 16.8 [Sarcoptes scabiei]|uniref:V-type proton ATPase subunit e 2-like protein n=1 Tax=Sarcoptes scabiei TaxID=52283 RepID=A0A132ABH2_SARSC|nr:V-type proton ATPase subunit e 2-like protein [Sarcoptes scabiei]UXI22466.1 Cuticle protein 16.8 [Sarcoptes scabiei]
MGYGVIILFTSIFAGIGFGVPLFLPEDSNKEIVKLMILMSAFCCYLMWLVTYMSQMNPLFGPIITNTTATLMRREWS